MANINKEREIIHISSNTNGVESIHFTYFPDSRYDVDKGLKRVDLTLNDASDRISVSLQFENEINRDNWLASNHTRVIILGREVSAFTTTGSNTELLAPLDLSSLSESDSDQVLEHFKRTRTIEFVHA